MPSCSVRSGAPSGKDWSIACVPNARCWASAKHLGLYANLRPAKLYPMLADASTLKREVIEGIDILVVRELTGGIYFGKPKGIEKLPNGSERGINTEVYTTEEIQRIAKVAFEAARKRRKKVDVRRQGERAGVIRTLASCRHRRRTRTTPM